MTEMRDLTRIKQTLRDVGLTSDQANSALRAMLRSPALNDIPIVLAWRRTLRQADRVFGMQPNTVAQVDADTDTYYRRNAR